MEEYDTQGVSLFRPLISSAKQEILDYAHEKNIDFREDSSNLSTQYLRNHLRYNVLPEFEKINPEYRQAFENFIDYTEELKSWIDQEILLFLGEGKSIMVHEFEKKSLFFQKEIIRYLYEQANNGTVGLSEGGIDELLRYILTAE
jgi:tRNA(Ile)-lysidine synthase TilS/MesJ